MLRSVLSSCVSIEYVVTTNDEVASADLTSSFAMNVGWNFILLKRAAMNELELFKPLEVKTTGIRLYVDHKVGYKSVAVL